MVLTNNKLSKLTGFFLLIIGLLLNKYYLEAVWVKDGNIEYNIFSVLIWFFSSSIFIFGIIILKFKFRIRRLIQNIIFSIFSFLVLINLLTGLDSLYGNFVKDEREKNWLFSSNQIRKYQTHEMNAVAKINKYGIRGGVHKLKKDSNVFRIMVVGDSHTYGYGVNRKQIWPFVLEAELNKISNKKVEVWNFGRPAFSVFDYRRVVDDFSKIIKPDLIVIGLLQGEDLTQILYSNMYQKVNDPSFFRKITGPISNPLKYFFKHQKEKSEVDFIDRLKKGNKEFLANANTNTIIHYNTYSEKIKNWFSKGYIAPNLKWAIRSPIRFRLPFDTSNQMVKNARRTIAEKLNSIDTISKEIGAKTLLLSIPYHLYVSEASLNFNRKLGCDLTEFCLEQRILSKRHQELATLSVDYFCDVTKRFRNKCKNEELYFVYDGHLNGKGNQFLGELLTKYFIKKNLTK